MGGKEGAFNFFYLPATIEIPETGIVISGPGGLTPGDIPAGIPDDTYTPIVIDGQDSGYGIIKSGVVDYLVKEGETIPTDISAEKVEGRLVIVNKPYFDVSNSVDAGDVREKKSALSRFVSWLGEKIKNFFGRTSTISDKGVSGGAEGEKEIPASTKTCWCPYLGKFICQCEGDIDNDKIPEMPVRVGDSNVVVEVSVEGKTITCKTKESFIRDGTCEKDEDCDAYDKCGKAYVEGQKAPSWPFMEECNKIANEACSQRPACEVEFITKAEEMICAEG